MTASKGQKAIFTGETVAELKGTMATKQGLSHQLSKDSGGCLT